MPYYDNDTIEEVRSRNDIVDVISQYVHLQKKGSSYFGLCPFHSEKTGSFSVTPSKQMYYCFGCGAGSTVIDFVMKLFNINFRQACLRLDADFSLGLTGEKPSAAEVSAVLAARRQEAERKAAADREDRGKTAEHCYWWPCVRIRIFSYALL